MSNKKRSLPEKKWVSGIPFPADAPDLMIQLWLFLRAPKFQLRPDQLIDGITCMYTGQGRFEHSKLITQILWPKKFEWHEWSTQIDEAACEQEWLFITGCGASSKSTTIGVYALKWWMSSPLESAVIIASKTIDSAKKRIWRETSSYYSRFSTLIGGYRHAQIVTSPRPSICPIVGADKKKDESHGLFVTALHGKELEKEIGYIKGFHPRRILVIADELDVLEDGGKALIDTYTDNLRTGTDESQFIGMGNDPSLFNALGDMMQPEVGKPITLNQTEWTSAKNVHCIRLDAWDSPNIKHNNKFTGLVRQSDIDALIQRKGENSPSVYIQLHGIHPPEGAENTILSESTLIRFKCFEPVTWRSHFITSASLDPAFGGRDACCFRSFKRGTDKTGTFRIMCWETLFLHIVANDPQNPAEYQIARQVKEACITRGIPPEEFAIGSTGIGRGTAAVLMREWSPRIVTVEENGAPSDLIVSDEDPRPANELYDRRVTELWFSIRQFVEADLIRGLDLPTATQLCSRTYEEKNRKRSIQKKDEMLHSPNEADALAFYIHLLREKGINATVTTPVKDEAQDSFKKTSEELDFDASELAYSNPLLDLELSEDF